MIGLLEIGDRLVEVPLPCRQVRRPNISSQIFRLLDRQTGGAVVPSCGEKRSGEDAHRAQTPCSLKLGEVAHASEPMRCACPEVGSLPLDDAASEAAPSETFGITEAIEQRCRCLSM